MQHDSSTFRQTLTSRLGVFLEVQILNTSTSTSSYVQDAGNQPQYNLGDSFAFCKCGEMLVHAAIMGRGNDKISGNEVLLV